MKNKDLLSAIGNARDEYILEAQPKTRKQKKLWSWMSVCWQPLPSLCSSVASWYKKWPRKPWMVSS